MEGTSHTSNYDVLVIKHKNRTLKSTPFQAVFSEKLTRNRRSRQKDDQLTLFVNEEQINLPMRLDQNGRVQFQKKYIRNGYALSDASDVSDDDISQRNHKPMSTMSREKKIPGSPNSGESIEELRNEQIPTKFWQFSWLFHSKPPSKKGVEAPFRETRSEAPLAKIKEEPYQGQLSNNQPLFQLSLCLSQLIKKSQKDASKEELEKIFYANMVEYKDFITNPVKLLGDENLVVRIDNSIYPWQIGAAVLACRFTYGLDPHATGFVDILKAKAPKRGWIPFFGRDNMTCLDIEKQPPSMQPYKLDQQEVIRWRRTPDSETLSKMKLKYGENKAKFCLEVAPGVIEETQFRVFLWDEDEKIVVSDIDGTITKSDVMGQLRTNFIHKGVCLLYNEVYKRNYKLLYMTARAISQYGMTRKFLQKQVQQNGMNLPPGPLFMSPDGYIKSFTRQVIEKTPDQLKIKLLASVNEIFPNSKKPITTGFGNRETDSVAYLMIKIPAQRIFCITEKSVISNEKNKQELTSYPEMLQKIDQHFPVYVKPELSQNSQSGIDCPQEMPRLNHMIDSNEGDALLPRRKMSHNEFTPSSPTHSDDHHKSASFSNWGWSKAKSEQGEPPQNLDFQLLIQEYVGKDHKDKELTQSQEKTKKE